MKVYKVAFGGHHNFKKDRSAALEEELECSIAAETLRIDTLENKAARVYGRGLPSVEKCLHA